VSKKSELGEAIDRSRRKLELTFVGVLDGQEVSLCCSSSFRRTLLVRMQENGESLVALGDEFGGSVFWKVQDRAEGRTRKGGRSASLFLRRTTTRRA